MFEKLFAQSGLSLERLKTFREIVAAGGITAAAGDDSNRQASSAANSKSSSATSESSCSSAAAVRSNLQTPASGFMKSSAIRFGHSKNSAARARGSRWN